jgi:hypothetical protein
LESIVELNVAYKYLWRCGAGNSIIRASIERIMDDIRGRRKVAGMIVMIFIYHSLIVIVTVFRARKTGTGRFRKLTASTVATSGPL